MPTTYNGYTIPAYTDGADAPSAFQDFADGVDTKLATKADDADLALKANNAPSQTVQTGTGSSAYTFVLLDASRVVIANAASSATYTIPPEASVAWPTGSIIRVVSKGTGIITFAAGAGVTVNNTVATLAQYDSATLLKTGTNTWDVIKGGGIPKASVSGTTGSPTVDTSSRPGKTIYKWTGTGSITIDRAGVVEVLVVAGGGGGGGGAANNPASGGGGGGVEVIDSFWLKAGTWAVVIGAGGSAGSGGGSNNGTVGNQSYIGGHVSVPGGGNGGGGNNTGGSSATGGGRSGTGITGWGFGAGAASRSGGGGAGAATATIDGGAGLTTTITGSSQTFGGGGGGGVNNSGTRGAGGTGGGGQGGFNNAGAGPAAGTANTGGGGGGAGSDAGGGSGGAAGGSGYIVIVVG